MKIILQRTQIPSHYVIYLTLTAYVRYTSVKKKEQFSNKLKYLKMECTPFVSSLFLNLFKEWLLEHFLRKRPKIFKVGLSYPQGFVIFWWERAFLQELEPEAFLPDSSEAIDRVWLENCLKVFRHRPESLRCKKYSVSI